MQNERMKQDEIAKLFINNKKETNNYLTEIDKHNYIYVYGNDMYPSYDIMLLYTYNEIRNGNSVLVIAKTKNLAECMISSLGESPFKIPKNTYTTERYSNITHINKKFDNIILLDAQDQKDKLTNYIKWVEKYLNQDGRIFIHEDNSVYIKNALKDTEYNVYYILD